MMTSRSRLLAALREYRDELGVEGRLLHVLVDTESGMLTTFRAGLESIEVTQGDVVVEDVCGRVFGGGLCAYIKTGAERVHARVEDDRTVLLCEHAAEGTESPTRVVFPENWTVSVQPRRHLVRVVGSRSVALADLETLAWELG